MQRLTDLQERAGGVGKRAPCPWNPTSLGHEWLAVQGGKAKRVEVFFSTSVGRGLHTAWKRNWDRHEWAAIYQGFLEAEARISYTFLSDFLARSAELLSRFSLVSSFLFSSHISCALLAGGYFVYFWLASAPAIREGTVSL